MDENENKEDFNFGKDFTVKGLEKIAEKIGAKKIKPKDELIKEVQKKSKEKGVGLRVVFLRKEERLETEEKKEDLPASYDEEERDLDDIKKLEKELKLREKKEGKDREGYKILVRELLIIYDEVSKARINLSSKLRAYLRKLREGAPTSETEKLKKEADKAQKSLKDIVIRLNRVKRDACESEKYKKKFKYLTVYEH